MWKNFLNPTKITQLNIFLDLLSVNKFLQKIY